VLTFVVSIDICLVKLSPQQLVKITLVDGKVSVGVKVGVLEGVEVMVFVGVDV
jgi:hypothetical protein